MRAELLKRVEPLVKKFAGELVDILAARMEVHLEQMVEAFDLACSSFATEIASDVAKPAAIAVEVDADDETEEEAPATPVRAGGRKPNTCSKCGASGFTARTCGVTHNKKSTTAIAVRSSSTPPPTRSADRFAAIEARAAARTGDSTRVERGAGPARRERRAVDVDRDEEGEVMPGLPVPRSSFVVDPM